MAVVLVATGWFLYVRLDSHLRTALDNNLRVRAQDLATVVRDTDTSLAANQRTRVVEPGESYAELLDLQGRVLDATPPLGATLLLSPEELRAARTGTIFHNRTTVPGLDEPSRLLATPITQKGKRRILVVGATRQDRVETLSSLRYELLIAGPVALILATLAGYLLAGLSLAPVESMRRRAAAISADTPGERLPVPDTRDEVQRLAETLNEMLARLEAALERERGFVADAGHELRTPLALLRTELELAFRYADSPEELREAVGRSFGEVDRLAQLAEDLLLIARSDRGELPLRLEELNTSDLLDSTARRFEWRAQESGRPVEATESDVTVRGDRIRLEQALGNLVDNALRHGGGPVVLSAESNDGIVELHVTDEGGGFPPGFLDHAFERFARADQARGGGGGSGLGLSIVQMIAEAHGGSAHAANTGRGADVWVVVPTSKTA